MPTASRLAWLAVVFLAAGGSATPLPAADYFPAVEAELVRLDQATRDLPDRFASELEAKLEGLGDRG